MTECPLAPDVFKSLVKAGEEAEYIDEVSIEIVHETVELVVEQLSESLGERLLGIKRRTRRRLEALVLRGGFDESFRDVLSSTIDLAKEVDDQGYVALEGFNDEFLIPWLQTLEYWLLEDDLDCECWVDVVEFLERFT